ncbi:TPA: hypothetical protein ACGCEE_000686 [Stenotrophomonas maltophilia]
MFGGFKRKSSAPAGTQSELVRFANQYLDLALMGRPAAYYKRVAGSRKAMGYVWGVHDAYAQRLGMEPGQAPSSAPHFGASYATLFGRSATDMYFKSAFELHDDPDHRAGEQMGGEDVFDFLDKGKNFSRLLDLLQ